MSHGSSATAATDTVGSPDRLTLQELAPEALLDAALLLAGARLAAEKDDEPRRVRPPTAVDLAIASVLLRAKDSSALFASRENLGSAFGYRDAGAALSALTLETPPQGVPRARGMFTGGPNGAFLAHAAGAGWAFRSRGESSAALAVFDASLIDAGEFHTGVNFAGVMHARTVFFAVTREPRALHDIGLAYGIEEATHVARHVTDLLVRLEGPMPSFVHLDVTAFANDSLDVLARELAAASGRAGAARPSIRGSAE